MPQTKNIIDWYLMAEGYIDQNGKLLQVTVPNQSDLHQEVLQQLLAIKMIEQGKTVIEYYNMIKGRPGELDLLQNTLLSGSALLLAGLAVRKPLDEKLIMQVITDSIVSRISGKPGAKIVDSAPGKLIPTALPSLSSDTEPKDTNKSSSEKTDQQSVPESAPENALHSTNSDFRASKEENGLQTGTQANVSYTKPLDYIDLSIIDRAYYFPRRSEEDYNVTAYYGDGSRVKNFTWKSDDTWSYSDKYSRYISDPYSAND